MKNHFAVIMAGGSGTRFWPLSRQKWPKQLLPLFSEKTLLEETVDRVRPLFPVENILVVCNQEYAESVHEVLPDLPLTNILSEPVGRNTAPCVSWAACEVYRRNPKAIMAVMPADHFIKDTQRFSKLLEFALHAAESQDVICTLGIIPTSPHTGYGYIHASEVVATVDATPLFKADQFVEKPGKQLAEEYLSQGGYFWNSGIFVWPAALILEELEQFLPDIALPMRQWFSDTTHSGSGDASFCNLFRHLPAISIDYGVMEKSRRVTLIRGDFGWNDVGSWDAIESLVVPGDAGNVVVHGNPVLIDTKRCIVHGRDVLIACVGIEDLVVVATGDAVLISRKDRCQDVKQIVEQLRGQALDRYL